MADLEQVAPAFVEIAHRIVWASAATVDPQGRPWTRVLHPLWTWDGTTLTGIVATDPRSPKQAHLAANPHMSFTYWDPAHDTCNAQCRATWDLSDEGREAAWQAFADAPPPVGYDPSIIHAWPEPTVPAFGILRLEPWRLYVMPAAVMTEGRGEVLTWRAPGS